MFKNTTLVFMRQSLYVNILENKYCKSKISFYPWAKIIISFFQQIFGKAEQYIFELLIRKTSIIFSSSDKNSMILILLPGRTSEGRRIWSGGSSRGTPTETEKSAWRSYG